MNVVSLHGGYISTNYLQRFSKSTCLARKITHSERTKRWGAIAHFVLQSHMVYSLEENN